MVSLTKHYIAGKATFFFAGFTLAVLMFHAADILVNMSLSPGTVLLNYYNDRGWKHIPRELLKEIEYDDKYAIVFYINHEDNLSLAILKKTPFGYERFMENSGSRSNSGEVDPIHSRGGGTSHKAENLYLSWEWGTVLDTSVTRVVLDGYEANVIDMLGMKVYYLLRYEETEYDGKYERYFYDSDGNLLYDRSTTG